MNSSLSILSCLAVILLVAGCNSTEVSEVPVEKAQMCVQCQSTRYGKTENWTVIYKSSAFDSCSHRWEDGLTTNHRRFSEPVADDTVVLLQMGDQYGAFRLVAQTDLTVIYRWHYRTDGKGTFSENDEKVHTDVSKGNPIAFGPFSISWSKHSLGYGWIYYPNEPGDPVDSQTVRMCVTDETDARRIDASDPKWIYKASTIDPGIPRGINRGKRK